MGNIKVEQAQILVAKAKEITNDISHLKLVNDQYNKMIRYDQNNFIKSACFLIVTNTDSKVSFELPIGFTNLLSAQIKINKNKIRSLKRKFKNL